MGDHNNSHVWSSDSELVKIWWKSPIVSFSVGSLLEAKKDQKKAAPSITIFNKL